MTFIERRDKSLERRPQNSALEVSDGGGYLAQKQAVEQIQQELGVSLGVDRACGQLSGKQAAVCVPPSLQSWP